MKTMRIIYADSLVILNFAIDYLLLLATGKICALPLNPVKMGLGALLGGFLALLCSLYPHFLPAIFKLGGGFVLVFAAFGKKGILRTYIVFMAVSAFFGGCQYAAAHLSGGAFGKLSLRTLIFSFGICYALLSLVFKGRARLGARECAKIKVAFRGREVSFTALRDTGNHLTDASCRPVMIAEEAVLAPLFPELALPYPKDASSMLFALSALPGLMGRCRLFPCITATAPEGILPAFRPDSIEAAGTKLPHAYIAIVHTPLSSDGSFRAIF